MNRKRTKKGFTLIELIIVLAIFSIILTLVMSFIDPVSKLMSRASIKERTAAYVDNIEEYVDNSIHYAKFIRVFDGGFCTATDDTETTYTRLKTGSVSGEEAALYSFVDWLLGGVVKADSEDPVTGKVHVMKLINNPVDGLKAGHIYESVYDFTAAESYETVTYKGDGSIDTRVVAIRPGKNDSEITLSGTANVDVINPEHFENYNYYYKLGFYNLEPIPASDKAYKDAGKNAYYSWLKPLTDNSGNELTNDDSTGKNFALNVVAYQSGGKEAHTYTEGDGPSAVSHTVDIFKSPCHMSTASMAFINAIKTDEVNAAPFYKLKTDAAGNLEDGKVQYEEIKSINMGLAYRLLKPKIDADGDGVNDPGDGNIYIIYILPEEINDSQIVYD